MPNPATIELEIINGRLTASDGGTTEAEKRAVVTWAMKDNGYKPVIQPFEEKSGSDHDVFRRPPASAGTAPGYCSVFTGVVDRSAPDRHRYIYKITVIDNRGHRYWIDPIIAVKPSRNFLDFIDTTIGFFVGAILAVVLSAVYWRKKRFDQKRDAEVTRER